ncbi:energy-coupling factor transporter transmembrane component T [Alicyclobacillus mengziensis]|uniref:Uncharacterized protein n=1 Tax=Alicyclobacillus mengziensis TaxID=2931921 RepID=A0A9X7Z8H4_9BACL|nr:energy-coupling factor transporter transmembrane component T [Alicyclobacillus mengziensis]QSO48318.1 hypothetical protein JZ786_04840 [Alicyclobacillus mengziensis]
MTKRIQLRRPHPYSLLAGLISWIFIAYQARDLLGAVACFIGAIGLQLMDTRSQRISTTTSPVASGTNESLLSANYDKLFRIFAFSLPLMVVYVMVQAVLTASTDGGRLLWQGPTIPALGTLALSTKSLVGGLVGALRLWSILLGVMAVVRLVQPDDVIVWLGRRFARAGLTLSMMMNFLPLMQQEYIRLREYVYVRGHVTAEASWWTRLRATGAVLQALLMNALERSWSLAESMFIRGYGSTSRSFYRRPRWSQPDTWMLIGFIAADGMSLTLGVTLNAAHAGLRWLFCLDVLFVFSLLVWMGGSRRANSHS